MSTTTLSDRDDVDIREHLLIEPTQDLKNTVDMDDTKDMYLMHNTSHNPLQVPGFGIIPFDYELHYSKRFAHGLPIGVKSLAQQPGSWL